MFWNYQQQTSLTLLGPGIFGTKKTRLTQDGPIGTDRLMEDLTLFNETE